MKTRTIFVLLLLTVAAFAALPQASAYETYVPPGQTLYGTNFNCGDCHVNPAGSGTRTTYGEAFNAVANHTTDPTYALQVAGNPPNATPEPNVSATPEETPEPNVSATPEETPEPNVSATPEETPEPNVSATPEETPEPNVSATPEETPEPNVSATPEETPGPTETRRVVEIIDNMSGVPLINESTIDILAEDFINFNSGDMYNITITRVTDGTVEYNASGTLTGGPKETIQVEWVPQTQGSYILRSDAGTTTQARLVQVINQKVITPIPELSTIALVSAGLLGLIGLARKRRDN